VLVLVLVLVLVVVVDSSKMLGGGELGQGSSGSADPAVRNRSRLC
jgi:hypothetical protein